MAAHGPDVGDEVGERDAQLDALPPELAGLEVQLHHSVGPQLVLANPTDRTLDVLDERGVVFLRIGPGGVLANLTAPAWYQSIAPVVGTVPPWVAKNALRDEPVEPRWAQVATDPSWGWFDRRLDPKGGESVTQSPGKDPEQWSVPVRFGDTASALRGRFVARRAPLGTLRARLVSDHQLAPGVRLSLLPGRPGSFFLKSDTDEVVTVFGSDGEPFLRFGPSGVEANLRSPTFSEVARLRGGGGPPSASDAEGEPSWERVSALPRYGWVDPRTLYGDGSVPDAIMSRRERTELRHWSLPVRIGSDQGAALLRVEGVTEWVPFDEKREREGIDAAHHGG